MKLSENSRSKIFLIWIINSLLFILLAGSRYYMLFKERPQVAIISKFTNINIIIRIISIGIGYIIIYFCILLISFVFFKIAKYLTVKITQIKFKYFAILIIFYIELILLTSVFNFKINYFIVGVYAIIFVVQDYLFSKIYKTFNTLRVTMLNSFYFIILELIMKYLAVYIH